MSKNCRSRRPENNKPEGKEPSKSAEVVMKIEIAAETVVAMRAASNLKNKWCLGSGALSHVCSYQEEFKGIGKTNACRLNLASSE